MTRTGWGPPLSPLCGTRPGQSPRLCPVKRGGGSCASPGGSPLPASPGPRRRLPGAGKLRRGRCRISPVGSSTASGPDTAGADGGGGAIIIFPRAPPLRASPRCGRGRPWGAGGPAGPPRGGARWEAGAGRGERRLPPGEPWWRRVVASPQPRGLGRRVAATLPPSPARSPTGRRGRVHWPFGGPGRAPLWMGALGPSGTSQLAFPGLGLCPGPATLPQN